MNTYYDSDGTPTAAVWPDDPESSNVHPVGDTADSSEAVRRLLEWLCNGRDVVGAGRRCILVGSVLGLPGCPRSLRALGRRMGISHEMARRLLTAIRAELADNRPM